MHLKIETVHADLMSRSTGKMFHSLRANTGMLTVCFSPNFGTAKNNRPADHRDMKEEYSLIILSENIINV